MRLLLIEDDIQLAELERVGLRREGFETDHSATAEDALTAIRTKTYDLIILDLGLPDQDGLSVLHDIRSKNKNVPILILTARTTLENRLKGLNGGADDYLVKPFAIEELAARIRALLRRPRQSLGTVLEVGNISFNAEARLVTVHNQQIKLTRREIDLLEQLMRRAGQVLSKEHIESRLYSYDDSGSANSIEVLVHRLRRKLVAADASAQIHTLRSLGYLLTEAVAEDEVLT